MACYLANFYFLLEQGLNYKGMCNSLNHMSWMFRSFKMIRHFPHSEKKSTLMHLLPRLSQFHLGSVATIYESKLRTLRNTNKIPSIFSNTCQLNHKFKNKKEIKPLPSL